MSSKRRDWHKAKIKYHLELAGKTLRQLARENGYTDETCIAKALKYKYPKAERIIAAVIGVDPSEIWPSRYNTVGLSKPKPIKKRSASTIARRAIARNKRA